MLSACAVPTEPASSTPSDPSVTLSTSSGSLGQANDQRREDSNESCSFSRGVTTCTSTEQHTETVTEAQVSGCMYGPNAVPGRRTRTSTNTYQVTTTTTTRRHGRSARVYDSRTETTRVLVSSTFVSDVCEAI